MEWFMRSYPIEGLPAVTDFEIELNVRVWVKLVRPRSKVLKLKFAKFFFYRQFILSRREADSLADAR
jgi:hypothetical protein